MVNNEEFANRIKKLLSFYAISAAQLADKIGVQRSSISHLLSGRNKPSLDFVVKIIQAYDEVDLYWLLNGKGNFPKIGGDSNKSDISPISSIEKDAQVDLPLKASFVKATSDNASDSKKIEHIIIFYKDGSFKKYEAV
ncbi:MAG: helix-turn-helix transcriptional regulator [Flavobacteriales bacterium]|jgi:transcriptional regulator with XRE-family HTH domain|nr:helix-turn-helix transcriptional regulator [Flavobacteriales bacterium]